MNEQLCILSNQDADQYINNIATSKYISAICVGEGEGSQLKKEMKPHECTCCLYFIWAWRAPLLDQGQDLWPQSCFKFKRPCSKSQVLLLQLNPIYLAQNDINLNTTLQLSLVCMRRIVCIKASNIWVEDNPKVPWSLNTKISFLSQRKKLQTHFPHRQHFSYCRLALATVPGPSAFYLWRPALNPTAALKLTTDFPITVTRKLSEIGGNLDFLGFRN